MASIFFYVASAIMLAFGALVVLLRNPVASALSLVVSFVGLAGLFISLDAKLIGIMQILVYAGAVMVLFLFIIMLLDLKAEERRKFNKTAIIGGVAVAGLFVLAVVQVLAVMKGPVLADIPLALPDGKALDDTRLLGWELYLKYPFHILVMGLLLLSSTIGVIVLSRKEPTK